MLNNDVLRVIFDFMRPDAEQHIQEWIVTMMTTKVLPRNRTLFLTLGHTNYKYRLAVDLDLSNRRTRVVYGERQKVRSLRAINLQVSRSGLGRITCHWGYTRITLNDLLLPTSCERPVNACPVGEIEGSEDVRFNVQRILEKAFHIYTGVQALHYKPSAYIREEALGGMRTAKLLCGCGSLSLEGFLKIFQ